MTAVIAIRDELPPQMRDGLARTPGLTLLTGAPASALLVEGSVCSLEVRHIAPTLVRDAELTPPMAAGALLLLVDGVLEERDALSLEDRGVAFVDATGRAWSPGVNRSTKLVKRRRRSAPLKLRAAQLLADHPDEEWTEAKLAKRAGVSHGTVHNLLQELVASNLIERSGRGRAAHGSTVIDRRSLRRWLTTEASGQVPDRLPCFVRNRDAIPGVLAGIPLVRSGSGGAMLLGLPVVSETTRLLIRIPVTTAELAEFPAALGGVRTDRAPNVILIADPDRLASLDMRKVEHDLFVAPPSRIAIDLRLEPRGNAAASVFLDLWGDSIL